MPFTEHRIAVHVENWPGRTLRWYVLDRNPPFTEYRRGTAGSMAEALSLANGWRDILEGGHIHDWRPVNFDERGNCLMTCDACGEDQWVGR